MLNFGGNAFERSPALRAGYQAFMDARAFGRLFFSIDYCEKLPQGYGIACMNQLQVTNAMCFSWDSDASCVRVKSDDYECYAEQEFSQVCITPSLLSRINKSTLIYLNEVLYYVARFRALYLDMLVLHASAVVYRDETMLFFGVSGAGKSTQARLWKNHTDAWVLNYDKPVVSLEGDKVIVSGSPWCGKENVCINEVRPAKALLYVKKAKENRLERLSPAQAYTRVYLNFFVHPLNADIEQRYQDAVMKLISLVPVYDLYCTKTEEAVEVVRRELYGE